MAGRIDTTLRQWCKICQRATLSRIDEYGDSICAEHVEPREDDEW